MTNLTAAGYIIQDKQGNAIFGIGQSVDEAWAEVVREMKGNEWIGLDGEVRDIDEVFQAEFKAYGATQALLDKVQADGGQIGWEIVGGVACTEEEATAE